MKYIYRLVFLFTCGMVSHAMAQQSKNILPDLVKLPPSASYSILNTEPLVISQYFDTTSFSWVNTRKYINERNSSNDLVAYKIYDWVDTSWINSGGFINKLVYTNSKITEAVQSDIIQDFLLNAYQYKYTYDGNGKIVFGSISKDQSPIFTGDYKPVGADSFIYVGGNFARRTIYDIIYDSVLIPSAQVIYGYDSLLRINSETFQIYDVDLEEWMDDTKRIYTYNSANKIVQYTKQVVENFEWVNKENTTYTYTGANLTEYTRFSTDTGYAFVPSVRYQYTYNGNLLSSIIQSSYYDSVWYNDAKYELNYVNTKLSYSHAYEWDSKLNAWYTMPSLRLIYTESKVGIAQVKSISDDAYTLYPNPSQGQFSIQSNAYESVDIYTMQGVLLQHLNPQDDFQIPNNESGIYFIAINTKEGTVIKRLAVANSGY